MPTSVTALPSATLPADAECVVFVGRADPLIAAFPHLPDGLDRTTWERMIRKTDAGDGGKATTTWLPSGRRVAAAVLPEPCSRHNAPSRSWAVPQALGAAGASGTTHVVACLEDADHAAALAMAIARCFPSYVATSKTADRTITVAAVTGSGSVDLTPFQPAMDACRLAADLVDRPPNVLTTEAMVAEAHAVAQRVGARVLVIVGEELERQGLLGLFGVGKASATPPALVVLDHGDGDGGEAWVGKGITYDTGGLSIKTKTGMPGMKGDMGGAAAVLSSFEAAIRMGYEGRLTAVLCVAENAVGPQAQRPDDIVRMYSGKTVEVNNTDAEGRLVLADGIAWVIKHRAPSRVVDLATLTGAQLIATGLAHAALYCTDEALERRAVEIGRATGDLCHPLPYAPELFRREFASPVADMKNSVKNRNNAQSSCAGQFIANHLGEFAGTWLHVDMAGPSNRNGRGTGYGVGLLLGLVNLL